MTTIFTVPGSEHAIDPQQNNQSHTYLLPVQHSVNTNRTNTDTRGPEFGDLFEVPHVAFPRFSIPNQTQPTTNKKRYHRSPESTHLHLPTRQPLLLLTMPLLPLPQLRNSLFLPREFTPLDRICITVSLDPPLPRRQYSIDSGIPTLEFPPKGPPVAQVYYALPFPLFHRGRKAGVSAACFCLVEFFNGFQGIIVARLAPESDEEEGIFG